MRYRSYLHDSDRWAAYRHRPGDIIITTPPKCGTTWTQNIVGMLVLDTTSFDRPVAELSPWFDQLLCPVDDVVADLDAMEHRRFIKTHTPLDGLPWFEDVTYLCVLRDPRDAAVSWDHHFANMDLSRIVAIRSQAHGLDDLVELPPLPMRSDDPAERWWAFMTARGPSREFAWDMELLACHASVAWERRFEPNVVLSHYADLQHDLGGEVRRIAERLGIEVSEARLAEVVAAASFSAMRERADALVPNAGQIWLDHQAFFHSGTSGQWRDIVGDDADERYQAIVRELVDDEELLAWLHRP